MMIRRSNLLRTGTRIELCSEHPDRSGAATVPWSQLAISVPIADDLPAVHIYTLVKGSREHAAKVSLEVLVIEQRAKKCTSTTLNKQLQDGHRAKPCLEDLRGPARPV